MPTPKINVAAAASLKNGLGEIIEDFEGTYGVEICVKYAGSYALANEIVAGCPYDIYLAASILDDNGFRLLNDTPRNEGDPIK